MTEIPKVVGQGSYGCVIKPSIECKQKTLINYKNKVSKILHKTDAKKEMAEYNKVSAADKKNDFYLGKPHKCDIFRPLKHADMTVIQKCDIGTDVLASIEEYNLIVMDDGGENLVTYTDKMRSWSKSEMSNERCEKFLLEIPRLLTGLKLFLDNDLIHFDLKPQNVVYNEKTNRLNFIDFGMMKTRKIIKAAAEKSICSSAFFHWSYPWELQFINKNKFDVITKNDYNQDNEIRIIQDRTGPRSENLKHFFYFTIDKSCNDRDFTEKANYYIEGYEAFILRSGLMSSLPSMKYDDFLNKALDTIDIFGIGIALNYWIHVAKKHLDTELANKLEQMFWRTINPNLVGRYDINALIADYHLLLLEFKLLEKYDVELVDGIVIERKAPSPHKAEGPVHIPRLKKPEEEFVMADPAPCPEGKEINPKTGRCIKIKAVKDINAPCPEGKERNPKTGRCIKIKAVKDITAPCPEGKERNPKTRRCVKKCKEGYERNANFRCIKHKTAKRGDI
jgi:serine/threonine protein kinase